jgi:hypothetical protein
MSIVKRAVRGTVASALSVVPLGTVLGIMDAILSDDGLPGFGVGFAFYILIGVPCAFFVTLLYGLPIYVLLQRLQAAVPAVLVVCGAIGGLIVQAAFLGLRSDDWLSPLFFAVFGMSAGAAFWYGAERWRTRTGDTSAAG